METHYLSKIYSTIDSLPPKWNTIANSNIFLNIDYLKVLEKSSPNNMQCHFIGVFYKDDLVGIGISQFLNLNELESFGERDQCIKTAIRNFIFKNFSSHVLFIGNNMLTGQNAFSFIDTINLQAALIAINEAVVQLKNSFKLKGIKIHIVTYKDFFFETIPIFSIPVFKNYYQFSSQPNMIFYIKEQWKTEQDYIEALSKKYRDQYKRARKKLNGIEKRKLNLEEIKTNEETIYNLYYNVAKNAPFNTFFLAKNHFSVFKENLKNNFLFYGYFIDGQLIGFNTLIKNGTVLETYFLGYDSLFQKEKMLYLNMLYDMIGYAINNGYREIIFARTALEIKSAVGAKPIKMYGIMEHSNRLINRNLNKIFPYLEPENKWQERNPFK